MKRQSSALALVLGLLLAAAPALASGVERSDPPGDEATYWSSGNPWSPLAKPAFGDCHDPRIDIVGTRHAAEGGGVNGSILLAGSSHALSCGPFVAGARASDAHAWMAITVGHGVFEVKVLVDLDSGLVTRSLQEGGFLYVEESPGPAPGEAVPLHAPAVGAIAGAAYNFSDRVVSVSFGAYERAIVGAASRSAWEAHVADAATHEAFTVPP